MATVIKAQRSPVDIAGIEVFGYLLPNNTYKLAGRNVTDAIEEEHKTLPQMLGVKSLREIVGSIQIKDDRGWSAVGVPVEIALDYWAYMATNRGNRKATKILQTLSSNPDLLRLPADFKIFVTPNEDIEKIIKKLHRKYARKLDKENPEKQVEKKLIKRLSNSKNQVVTDVGIIDILTPTEIIEVKAAKSWKSALGQVLVYGGRYPNHKMRIHLFGSVTKDMEHIIMRECDRFGVIVTWEDL